MKLKELFWGKQKGNVTKHNVQEELVTKQRKNGILIVDESVERCEMIRVKVEKALSILQSDLEVDSTTDPNTVMEYGVVQFPAIILNGSILVQGKRVDVPELVQLLKNYI